MREFAFIANLLIILHIFSYTHDVFAWNDKVTHADISEYAAQSSVLDKSKGDYLSNLGFTGGLDETFKWKSEKTVKKWLREGAILEDSGNYWEAIVNDARYNNHFHDPLKAWSSAGLTDLVPFSTESAIIWAQDGNYQSSFPEGDWSWNKMREYYYIALTGRDLTGTEVALAKEDRDVYFAKTFRGLGHQMHLIEDITQPDHVRNDSHIVDSLLERNLYGSYYLEAWASKNPTVINSLAANPVLPSVSFDTSHDGLVPITQLIDTDQYDGSSPSTSLSQGLAEYTNANFFGDDTIFAAERYSAGDEHYFSYPKRSSTDLDAYISGTKLPETIIDEDGNEYTNTWISKVADGETIDHFITSSYLTDLTYAIFGEGSLYYSTFYRDEKCHEDYATQLIPKAVGYSAGLLNYFFRGELEVVKNTYSDSITITNNSSEDMDGTFTLYYDAADDARKPVSDGSWSLVLESGSTSDELSFTEPTDLGEDERYILVFEGTLGSESHAVAGKIGFCSEEFKLIVHDVAKDDYFGYSVAISGDVAIVGSPYDDNVGVDSGSAYVFARNGERWEQQAKLTASDAAIYDNFGYSVAISGDVAIVGSLYDENDAGYWSGSAYIFVRNGDIWEEKKKLTASDATEDEEKLFGWSVAISGDVAIVGAIEDSDFGNNSGSAYVFILKGDTWEDEQKLTASNAAAHNYFGWSVGISGDVAIVGTWLANSAYVFTHNGVTWEEQAKLTASDVARGDWFGYSVGISGDVAIVGSLLDDDAGNSSGSAYVFVRNGDTWEEKKKLTASDAAAGDNFGDSVAISGDTAIVGSPYDDNAESNSGSAYIFVRNGNTWEEKKKLTSSDTASGDSFGYSVAISGDVAIVGSPYDDDAGTNSGSAYIKYYNGCSQEILAQLSHKQN